MFQELSSGKTTNALTSLQVSQSLEVGVKFIAFLDSGTFRPAFCSEVGVSPVFGL